MNDKKNAMRISGRNWDGLLYETGGREETMIVFSGSDGGLQYAGKCAKYLYDNGVSALALGYFKTEHSEKALDRIPVEIVKDAAECLKQLGYNRIGIEGISKGAELALAAAVLYPVFFTVIVKTPSWFYSEGLISSRPSGHSCWTVSEKEIPFTPYSQRKFHMAKMIVKAGEFNILPVNTGKLVREESIIPVEKIQAPILMFSTKRDTVWPSEESCTKMIKRLQNCGFSYPYKHVSYDHMSHMMLEYCGKEVKCFFKSEREDPEACLKERENMGKTTVEWIREARQWQ